MAIAASSKRIVQMLWLAAGLLFTLALLHSLGSPDKAKEWASNKVGTLMNNDGGRNTMREFMATAESIWAKTVKQRHDMIAEDYGDASLMPLFPATDPAAYGKHPYSIWDFAPASYSCPHEMERVGRMGDGGKWVCGMSRYVNFPRDRECVIYSFGVRDESSFENEMLSRTNCVVWAYDFSVVDFGEQLEPGNRARAHFLQAGISGKTDKTKTPPFYSIADLMKMNGHEYIDILKMDIEFAEFEAMDGFGEDFPIRAGEELPVGQLMIEIHFFNGMTSSGFLDWWERLESRGLRPTWTEPNLLAVTLNLGNKDPLLAEYTMINVHDSKNVVFGGRH
ncbi:hypothetical protein COL5a_003684 [Colletotrichum fioriniae]|uniref:uncharacterized protein n=1 Tax=Colletotrichum fioriniae TaxID=710243 RepID=UPI0023015938|nr:uncharacterized protein COL516b_004786 [Colletotrichum fioriniae]KAJ0306327.1 hypothetical protein COL516b_004786 [Colletotrichum fioriniae]KAJ0329859.1 hypothetical protein COL5a_003684 [Colletotrichum fioriniae]KAJ3948992.1 hypothetical protein N0V96_000099 [Colletotrichum fioriniae]